MAFSTLALWPLQVTNREQRPGGLYNLDFEIKTRIHSPAQDG